MQDELRQGSSANGQTPAESFWVSKGNSTVVNRSPGRDGTPQPLLHRPCHSVPRCSSGKMKQWYHIDCLFEAFTKQRAATKKIESASDILGWETMNSDVQERLLQKIKQSGGSGEKPQPKAKVFIHIIRIKLNSINFLKCPSRIPIQSSLKGTTPWPSSATSAPRSPMSLGTRTRREWWSSSLKWAPTKRSSKATFTCGSNSSYP